MKYAKDIIISLAGTIVRVAVVIIAIVFIVNTAKKAYDFGYRIFTEEPMSAEPGRDVVVTVTSSDGDSELATMLEEKGLVRDGLLFRIQKKLSIYKDKVAPGSYTLNTSMTTDEMLDVMLGDAAPADELLSEDEYKEELDPTTDDLTGLETGGVLSEEGSYDESDAFAEDTITIEPSDENEFEGEGDEESAIEN